MATNATISCPQLTLVPVDFFGAVGDAAFKRLTNETRKPDRRAHVKHLGQLAIVAGLASSIEDTAGVSYTVLKDGSVRIGFLKNLNTNPWATIDQQASHIRELNTIIRHGKADNAAKHARICHLEEKLHLIKAAVAGPFGDVVNAEDHAVRNVQEIIQDIQVGTIASIAARFFEFSRQDFDYIWAWQCNLAMGIFGRVKGISHRRVNEIAADLMEVIFSINVREMSQWQDLLKTLGDGEGMISSIGSEIAQLKTELATNEALRQEIAGMKEELSELRAKVAERNYETLADEYISNSLEGVEVSSRALCAAAIRDFAESLTK